MMNRFQLKTSPRAVESFLCWRAFFYLAVVVFLGHASVLAAPGPAIRTGLWVTQRVPKKGAEMTRFQTMVQTNPHLSGVCLHIGWKELEKEAGHFDFNALDEAVAVLRAKNMKYELNIRPGAETPAYVFSDGAQSFQTRVSNPYLPTFGKPVVIPIPWDPKYQENFSRLIAKTGERYAGDSLCISVVLTCANFMSSEMHLPKSPKDRAKWKQAGDYEARLLEVYKKYTGQWAKAFPKQQISLHLSQALDLPPSFFESIIDDGLSQYPERFTIQNCQLTGRNEDTGISSYKLVLKYQDRAHHGFQSVGGFSRGRERIGSMEMAVLNVVHAQGEYWEIWHDDGLSVETSAAIETKWREAKQLGYDAYKAKLISEAKYREEREDHFRPGGDRRPANVL